jgi:VIT1/CCC1 family predicted Fe2+/Mn2+ transporter
MSRRDAEMVVTKMAQYEGFFVSLMVAEDLGLQLADEHDATFLTESFVMLLSFASFASIPILIFCLPAVGMHDEDLLYLTAVGVSLAVLTVLSVVKSRISSSSWFASSVEGLSLGVFCAALSRLVGSMLVELLLL